MQHSFLMVDLGVHKRKATSIRSAKTSPREFWQRRPVDSPILACLTNSQERHRDTAKKHEVPGAAAVRQKTPMQLLKQGNIEGGDTKEEENLPVNVEAAGEEVGKVVEQGEVEWRIEELAEVGLNLDFLDFVPESPEGALGLWSEEFGDERGFKLGEDLELDRMRLTLDHKQECETLGHLSTENAALKEEIRKLRCELEEERLARQAADRRVLDMEDQMLLRERGHVQLEEEVGIMWCRLEEEGAARAEETSNLRAHVAKLTEELECASERERRATEEVRVAHEHANLSRLEREVAEQRDVERRKEERAAEVEQMAEMLNGCWQVVAKMEELVGLAPSVCRFWGDRRRMKMGLGAVCVEAKTHLGTMAAWVEMRWGSKRRPWEGNVKGLAQLLGLQKPVVHQVVERIHLKWHRE